ncbi:hypothetical protein VKT23_016275 [Stygiomarasmius scandens]|uniref:Zinc finger PHD-type domain-containing protein n=1 Tax=Marasmiellus scandens TaxID=2682957 RepID=A0ABR1IY81_9AGAR
MSFFPNTSHFSVHTLTINNIGGNQVTRNKTEHEIPSDGTEEDEFLIVESTPSISFLESIATSISSPSLKASRELILSLLRIVGRAEKNKDILINLVERAVQVTATIDDALRKGVEALTRSLEQALRCVEEDGRQSWIRDNVFSQRVALKAAILERDLDEVLAAFKIDKLASLQDVIGTERYRKRTSSVNTRTVAYEDIDPIDNLHMGPHYEVHSAKLDGQFVVLKVFHGSRADEHLRSALTFSRQFLNPNILRAAAASSPNSCVPFIVFDGSCQANTESRIASALTDSLSRSVRLGLTIVSGLSVCTFPDAVFTGSNCEKAGLDYLFMNDMPPSSFMEQALEIYITDNDIIKIGFGAVDLESGLDDDVVDDAADKEDRRWGMFNNLCRKTFGQASHLLHQDEGANREELEPAILEILDNFAPSRSTSGPSSSTTRLTEEPSSSSVKPRRELVWRVPTDRLTTVSAIARHYRRYLQVARIQDTQYPLRYLSAHAGRQSRIRHRCLGYKKEEISLTTTIDDSAVISRVTPSLHEICSVCGEIVDNGNFNCICGLEDDGFSATVKCSRCLTWGHLACADAQATFICELCQPACPVGEPSDDRSQAEEQQEYFDSLRTRHLEPNGLKLDSDEWRVNRQDIQRQDEQSVFMSAHRSGNSSVPFGRGQHSPSPEPDIVPENGSLPLLEVPQTIPGLREVTNARETLSQIFTPFRYLSARHRTLSGVSVEAVDGVADNTVERSPQVSVYSSLPPMTPPLPRNPFLVVQEWQQRNYEAEHRNRSQHRIQRPGVVFDVPQED